MVRSPKWFHYFIFPTKFVYLFFIFSMLDIKYIPTMQLFIYSANNICLGRQIMNFLSKQFSHLSLVFFLPDPSILPCT
jgi:hypothetical protein